MIKWTKKIYARELKKGYWELEPHFYYYAQIQLYNLFETFVNDRLQYNDIQSALYGEFVTEGKPIKKGFYDSFNLISKIVRSITKDTEFFVKEVEE